MPKVVKPKRSKTEYISNPDEESCDVVRVKQSRSIAIRAKDEGIRVKGASGLDRPTPCRYEMAMQDGQPDRVQRHPAGST